MKKPKIVTTDNRAAYQVKRLIHALEELSKHLPINCRCDIWQKRKDMPAEEVKEYQKAYHIDLTDEDT